MTAKDQAQRRRNKSPSPLIPLPASAHHFRCNSAGRGQGEGALEFHRVSSPGARLLFRRDDTSWPSALTNCFGWSHRFVSRIPANG